MKKSILTMSLLVAAMIATAKDIKTVVFTTTPIMHCVTCENKIKGNLRFERGVKKIETNVERQEVTISYDADKTDVERIQKGFEEIGYKAEVVRQGQNTPSAEKKEPSQQKH
ncbi:heavy-metal-associated domain-containing protein [Bacteroides heparinolyticus]|uniref:heavy-metal-associated domain-containing protein n=1 Tax=Prevotella heparinolytica TaxID=28113 RepID=UPI0035A0CAD0